MLEPVVRLLKTDISITQCNNKVIAIIDYRFIEDYRLFAKEQHSYTHTCYIRLYVP